MFSLSLKFKCAAMFTNCYYSLENTGTFSSKVNILRSSLVVQWLGLSTFCCNGPGSIRGRGTEIPQTVRLEY